MSPRDGQLTGSILSLEEVSEALGLMPQAEIVMALAKPL